MQVTCNPYPVGVMSLVRFGCNTVMDMGLKLFDITDYMRSTKLRLDEENMLP